RLSFVVADEGACALLGVEHAANFKLAIGTDDGVGVNGKIDSELPDGGKLIASAERARSHAPGHLIHDLAVDGDAARWVQAKAEGRGLFRRSGHSHSPSGSIVY